MSNSKIRRIYTSRVYLTYLVPFNILDEYLNKFSNEKSMIVGDFNAKSKLWGPQTRDNRGRGKLMIELINNPNLGIVNYPRSEPTYLSILGKKLDQFNFIL